MNITISSKEESGYLLLKVSGNIVDIEEYKVFLKRFLDIKDKYDTKNIIIDVSKVKFEKSYVLQNDIFKFFPDELSEEMKSWKIAIVVDSQLEDIGKFWEYKANKSDYNFYKVFTSIEEAKKFISNLGS